VTETINPVAQAPKLISDLAAATPSDDSDALAVLCWQAATQLIEKDEEIEQLRGQIDKLLAHCDDPECDVCGKIICPHEDDLHFHHDGCPSCCSAPL
jgi:hypothetical protein